MSNDPAYEAELRQRWRINWLTSIAEFSDFELQQKSWFGGSEYNSPYWSFVEWMCRYFDDFGMSAGTESFISEGFMNEQEAEIIRDFHVAAAAYKAPKNDDYDHKAILADPAWRHVVALADTARTRLMDVIKDPSERAALQPAS